MECTGFSILSRKKKHDEVTNMYSTYLVGRYIRSEVCSLLAGGMDIQLSNVTSNNTLSSYTTPHPYMYIHIYVEYYLCTD